MLIEFCSDLLVTQELSAGGRKMMLVPVSSGLWVLGGLSKGLLPQLLDPGCFSIHRGEILLLSQRTR